MMKVVRNPSMQMEKFDRPVHSVNCYDNGSELLLFEHIGDIPSQSYRHKTKFVAGRYVSAAIAGRSDEVPFYMKQIKECQLSTSLSQCSSETTDGLK